MDVTYSPKTYRKQGGDEYVVANGGLLTCESGGSIVVAAGGAITNSGTITNSTGAFLTNAGTITNATGANITNQGFFTNSGLGRIIESLSSVPFTTGADVLPNFGVSSVGSSTGVSAYKLAAPVAGGVKTIVASTGIGGAATITSTAATIGSTQGTIAINELGGSIQLLGLSASRWSVVGMSTGATVA